MNQRCTFHLIVLTISVIVTEYKVYCIGPEKLIELFMKNNISKPETTPDKIQKEGYPVEIHNVTSKSGYILTLHRIPHGKYSNSTIVRRPVIVQHGIHQSSAHWLLNGVNNSLGFLLAEAGYDVWLGNSRGNMYSNKHVSRKRDFKYWDFSFHELADEDVPAVIDYVLATTNFTKLYYIGFSLGTTTFITSMALHPKYNEKVILFIGMAPVIFLDHAKNAIVALARLLPSTATFAESIRQTFKIGSFPTDDVVSLVNKYFPVYCRSDMTAATLCSLFIYSMIGINPGQMNMKVTPLMQQHVTTLSFKILVHFIQVAASKRFQMFDYTLQNLKKYGSTDPPIYPLHNVNVRTALMWSENDLLSDGRDVNSIAHTLPNIVNNYRVPLDEFSHYDFVYGLDTHELVFKHCLSLLLKYDH